MKELSELLIKLEINFKTDILKITKAKAHREELK